MYRRIRLSGHCTRRRDRPETRLQGTVGHIVDGTSNTAAFSETTLGVEGTVGVPPTDSRFAILEVAGGNDPTPSACKAGNGTWVTTSGGQWINEHFVNTLSNHYYPPNPIGKRDWGNGSHNKALSTARGFHSGGVNLLLADGSVRFIHDNIDLASWHGLSSRAGGEVLGDFSENGRAGA